MSVLLSLHPYKKKWPKKPTIFKALEKDEFDFRNFYDFYSDLEKLPVTVVPDELIVWLEDVGHQLQESHLQYKDENPRLQYYKAGAVSKILAKHMKIWKDRLKKDPEAAKEEFGYYQEYMRKLKRMQRLKTGTPLIASVY